MIETRPQRHALYQLCAKKGCKNVVRMSQKFCAKCKRSQQQGGCKW